MRTLVNYIRSCFCNHDWELLNETTVYDDTDYWGRTTKPYFVGKKWTYRCKKCGYIKIYRDY